MTGLWECHMLMNFWVGATRRSVAQAKSFPGSHLPSV